MLTDPKEIEIISKAKQKNVRDHKRSRTHFTNIFSDFFKDIIFENCTLLDLGPGQYDLGELARTRGAITHGIDKDPAVIELGQYKGFPVKQVDLRRFQAHDFDITYDGVFCKYSINAFWFFDDEQNHLKHIRQIGSLIKENGWAWIAPWNGIPKKASLSSAQVSQVLSIQTEEFKRLGFQGFNLTEKLAKYYGVHGSTANRALFLFNLKVPNFLAKCEHL